VAQEGWEERETPGTFTLAGFTWRSIYGFSADPREHPAHTRAFSPGTPSMGR